MSIAQNIRHYRENQGISVDKFSKQTGLSIADCIRIEAGQQDVSPEEISVICRVLNVSYDELVDEPHTESVAMPLSELQNLLKMMK